MGVDPTSWVFLTMMCVTVLSGNISGSEQESDKSITSIASIGFFTFQSRVKMFSFVESQCSPMRLPGQRPSLPFETTSLPPCFFFYPLAMREDKGL